MLSQGSVTIASGVLTDLAALLALLEVDIGRTAGVEKRAVNEIQNKSEELPESSPLEFKSLTPVKNEPTDVHPSNPATVPSSLSFHCEEPAVSSEGNPSASSLPAPALMISIPFDRIAPKLVKKIKGAKEVATLPPKPHITCFFCG